MNYVSTMLELIIRIAVISILILAVSPCFAAQQLITTATFHGDEVTAKAGDYWIAITRTQKIKVPLKIKIVNDPINDEANKKTGKAVSATGIKPIFLVKDIANVSPGSCVTVLNTETELWKKPAVKLTLGTKKYEVELKLKVGKKQSPEDSYTPAHCTVFVKTGNSSDAILDKDCVADLQGLEAPRILWAGDIDADGKLDLLIDGTTQTNVSNLMLYTSSAAAKGKLLKKVAEFTTTGC